MYFNILYAVFFHIKSILYSYFPLVDSLIIPVSIENHIILDFSEQPQCSCSIPLSLKVQVPMSNHAFPIVESGNLVTPPPLQ